MTTVEQETLPVTLKPCPFCGAHDEFNPSVSQSHKYAEPGDAATGKVANLAAGLVSAGWYVECDECGGLGGQADDRAAAITAWNTRADHEPRAGEVGLREALRASLAKRSVGAMDPPWTAAFNAALDMVARDVAPFLAAQSPAPTEGEGWQDIASWEGQPTGQTNTVLLCVSDGGAHPPIVGEAWFDPETYDGTWWWANTSQSDYYASPIIEMHNGVPTFWQPMPAPPAAARRSTQPQADAGSADHSSTREG